jgi:hypothetical protein
MILYNFEKPILEVKLIDGDLENVVTTVHWRYTGTDENGISADMYGAKSLDAPDPQNFTEFEDLDNETICNWLGLDIEAMEANIANQIDLKVNPKIIITSID